MELKKCTVAGCNKTAYSQGGRWNSRPDAISTKFCRSHYQRYMRDPGADLTVSRIAPLEERFWRKVEKSNGCWNWVGAKNSKKYGFIEDKGKMILAHRLSYEIAHGELGQYDLVLHSCDNPSCVNPYHLRKGTCSENIKEAFDKGRKFNPIASGEENPRSKLTLEQVKFIKAHPELGHKEIADMFGLSPNCIRGVRIGRTWKHV